MVAMNLASPSCGRGSAGARLSSSFSARMGGLFGHVCACVYKYICMYRYIHIYLSIYIYIHICIYIYICTHLVYTITSVCIHTYLFLYLRTHTHIACILQGASESVTRCRALSLSWVASNVDHIVFLKITPPTIGLSKNGPWSIGFWGHFQGLLWNTECFSWQLPSSSVLNLFKKWVPLEVQKLQIYPHIHHNS